MESPFDYNVPLNQAFQRIKEARAPHSMNPLHKNIRTKIIKEETVLDFVGQDFDLYINTVSVAKEISISCLQFIIYALLKCYGVKYEEIPLGNLSCGTSKIHFAIKDLSTGALLFFKDPEKGPFWKVPDKEPQEITSFLSQHTASRCQYVYLMYDRAHAQIIGADPKMAVPEKDCNIYSLKHFFEEYFSEEEYHRFRICFANYISHVKQHLGYSVLKSLTPTAEVNFKRIVRHTLLTTEYERILNIEYEYEDGNTKRVRKLKNADFLSIQNQYVNDALYLVVLGNMECAESLVTAEWLYDSMKDARSVDLTAVAMGYFKAVEQFLATVVALISPNQAEWMDSPDSSLGAAAHFFKDNLHLFRHEISYPSRKYIRETLFSYSNLRNGFMHKHNIHGWEKVDEIRGATLNLFFLMLGALDLSADLKQALGMPSDDMFSDYARLCEYIDYHAGDLFFLGYGNGNERVVVAQSDKYQRIENHNYFQYSGAYFRTFAPPYQQGVITENRFPEEIYLGTIDFQNTESVQMKLIKSTKVFSRGRFIGPSIADEMGENY